VGQDLQDLEEIKDLKVIPLKGRQDLPDRHLKDLKVL
jgi:hypothetical protein